jgi:thiol-disulfide isomerase/thioredoxin
MTLHKMKSVFLALGLGFVAFSSSAVVVNLGDAPPKTLPQEWIQGDAVKSFEPGKVYLVEFWATWCPPCRESIPHLNALHNKFKDKGLVIIGVNAGESAAKARLFVKQEGTNMAYRVALDGDGKMTFAWFDPTLESFPIPFCYLIDKTGTVLYTGSPMALTESLIEQTVNGTMTLEKMRAYSKELERGQALFKLAAQYEESMQKKDWTNASALLNELEKASGTDKKRMNVVRFERLRLLLNRGDAKAASEFASKLSDTESKEDAGLLNAMAWELVTESGITERDYVLAEKLCRQADVLVEHKHPQVLDTLARIQFMTGKKSEAIATQEKAVSLAEGQMKAALQKNLDSYKDGKLPPLD